jgi:hypothetical protein
MKKYIAMIIAAFLIIAVSGCVQKAADTQIGDEENREEADGAKTESMSGDTGDWNTSGLTRAQIESIDWNLDAYNKYFRVDSGGATFHYWDLEICLAILPDGDLMYMSPESTIVIDAESGDSYETEGSFFAGMMPNAQGQEMDVPLVPLAPSDDYDFTLDRDPESGMYVFIFDLGESVNEYYINADLVCVGWMIETADGSASYYLGDDPGFENVVDEIMPEGAPEFEAP